MNLNGFSSCFGSAPAENEAPGLKGRISSGKVLPPEATLPVGRFFLFRTQYFQWRCLAQNRKRWPTPRRSTIFWGRVPAASLPLLRRKIVQRLIR